MVTFPSAPTLDEVASALTPYRSAGPRPGWREVMRHFPDRPSVGEVRTADDWRRFPVDRPVRVVYLVDERGPVLRWLTSDDDLVARFLGGFNHYDIEQGDGRDQARSGWIRRRPDGVIVVS